MVFRLTFLLFKEQLEVMETQHERSIPSTSKSFDYRDDSEAIYI
jgi:hypothetical protein